jgi:hypothetical protein
MSVDLDARVAVIGAGLSGLIATKELLARGVGVACFEREEEIGGVWQRYPDVVTVTCREAMAINGLGMPPDMPIFPQGHQLVSFMNTYADEFALREHIHTGHTVTAIGQQPDGSWTVTRDDGSVSHHRAVVVATGRIGAPVWPTLSGVFDGEMVHAGELDRELERFAGKRVLVIGFGNSAVDIACEVSRHAARTYLSIRRGAWVVPRFFAGKPLDAASGPIVTRIPMWLRWPVYRLLLEIIQGRMENYGLPRPVEKPGRRPLTVSDELLARLGAGQIIPVADIASIDGRHVGLTDGERVPVDAVICGTGYSIDVPLLEPTLRARGLHLERLWHNLAHPDISNLFVLGAMVAFGAIPPLAEAQAVLAAEVIAGTAVLPSHAQMERDIAVDRHRRRRFSGETKQWMVGETPAFAQRLRAATRAARHRADQHPVRRSDALAGAAPVVSA